MRVALLSALALTTLALAGSASGQTTVSTGPEILVREAYENQRTNADLMVEMRSTDTIGSVSVPIHAILYWRLSTDSRTNLTSRAQAELDIYQTTNSGDSLIMRIVGDGVSLYRYDVARREMSATTYGFYGTTPPGNYSGSDAPKLLAQLRTATPGLTAYLVRLLDELNPAGVNYGDRYADWLPGHPNLLFDSVPEPIRQVSGVREADTVHDPITGRTFVRGDDEWMFEGMDSTSTERTVAFHMVDENEHADGTTPKWIVQTVNVAQRSRTGRVVDLTLTLTPSTATTPSWAFVPYSGAQAAAFRPVAAAH